MEQEKIINIEELVQDEHNFNKGTDEGGKLMERSFKEMGAGRSVLIDKHGKIIAGNKSQKAAIAAGIKRVRVIETTGDELIAVKRTDVELESEQGRKMALLDNLTTQVNLAWDEAELQTITGEIDGFDVGDFGFDPHDVKDVDLPFPDHNDNTDNSGQQSDTEPAEEEEPEKLGFYFKMLGDFVYPSNNEFDIPTLLMNNMPVHLELPVTPWGAEARYKKMMSTYHFYVDDYRFEQLFKDPISLLTSGCKAIVEPNCSIHDQTPMAYAIYQTYRKRYLCRYLQECGMQIWVDLNVSPHFEEINALGVPEGYNAFCTRGVTGWLETTERHWQMAKRISGLEKPNMFVYGGGQDVEEWCKERDIVYIKEYMNKARQGVNPEQESDR